MRRELRFEVMGCSAVVSVVGGPGDLVEHARTLLTQLHARWSRFESSSEISQLNDADGQLCIVAPHTFELISTAIDGWHLTDGRFDPTILDALRGAGYRSPWAEGASWFTEPAAVPSPGCADIDLHPTVWGVRLPRRVRIDLGGVAKGFAADLTAAAMLDRGADGALVSIGGDVVVAGTSPNESGWLIEIGPASKASDHPVTIRLASGAVCTSSSSRRRWTTEVGESHHIIDPASGLPTQGHLVSATAVARGGAGAEIAATAALLARSTGTTTLDGLGLPGVVVDQRGRVTSNRFFDRLCTEPLQRAS
jgi:FAD:protein FMN transferase